MRRLNLVFAVGAVTLASCNSVTPPPDSGDASPAWDGGQAADDGSAAAHTSKQIYGTSTQGDALEAYTVTPDRPNGKKALLTFAIHGFEDAWLRDGLALFTVAHSLIEYYAANRANLNGWTVVIVPVANPDGMRRGINNARESAGAFGRCTSTGMDINRNVSQGTSQEQRALKTLFMQEQPTIYVDFHGWYNTSYGDAKIADFFERSFNAAYQGKPAKYCYVAASGSMDCSPSLGGVFHGPSAIGTDLFAQWATSAQAVPATLIEYPAPDYDLDGIYDTRTDPGTGYPVMRDSTLNLILDRTKVALDDLFSTY